jgi:starvation-inducible outer membrane lipoprotein
MRPDQKSILMLSLLLITLSSCSNQPQSISKEMEEKFQTMMPVTDMNGSLQLKVESGEKIYPLGSEIPLTIINTSPHSIFLQ